MVVPLKKDGNLENRCALIELLQDATGIGPTKMLSEWQRLQNVTTATSLQIDSTTNPRRAAANKLARRLLTCKFSEMIHERFIDYYQEMFSLNIHN